MTELSDEAVKALLEDDGRGYPRLYADHNPCNLLHDALTQLLATRAELAQARADAQAAVAALKPFADRVFYDNGDCTVTDTHTLKAEDFIRANRTIRAIASPSGGSKLAELRAEGEG